MRYPRFDYIIGYEQSFLGIAIPRFGEFAFETKDHVVGDDIIEMRTILRYEDHAIALSVTAIILDAEHHMTIRGDPSLADDTYDPDLPVIDRIGVLDLLRRSEITSSFDDLLQDLISALEISCEIVHIPNAQGITGYVRTIDYLQVEVLLVMGVERLRRFGDLLVALKE